MDQLPPHWNMDSLIHVFEFLPEEDLISASAVCKDWNEAAETPWLWRMKSLRRWGFCNLSVLGGDHVTHSWKTYFLRRCHLEKKMSKGRTGSYTCKSLRGHTGRVVGLVYLQENSAQRPDVWSGRATVSSASADGTVRAWDVQDGRLLWTSPVQDPLTGMVRDEQRNVLITADSTGLIKTWQGQTGQQLASFPSRSPHCALLQYNVDDGWFLTVGTSRGSVCTLSGPGLTERSSLMVCDSFKVNTLLISPDKRWIAAGTKDSDDFSPKVIYAESLTSPAEDEDPLCRAVAVAGCQAAAFIPSQPARLAIIHRGERPANKALSVFDVSIKKTKYKTEIQVQQVASFPLTLSSSSSPVLLEAKDSSCLVVAAGQELWVYSLTGALLSSFKEHTMPICALCVDSFRVVTASQDLSLRVLMWRRDGERGLALQSQYHLLGGSHSMSSGFSHVACDYSSIVASARGRDGKDVLKAYSFSD